MVQLILFIAAAILYAVVYPLSGYLQTRHLIRRKRGNNTNKTDSYKQSMIWSWIPAIIIIIVVKADGFSFEDIGICLISPKVTGFNNWVIYIALLSYIAYLCYNVYCILTIKYNKESRMEYSTQIPESLRFILPVSYKEKKLWKLLALTAGITEEIQYRGYLFFAIPLIFGRIPVWLLIVVSSVLFGMGHIYQGREAYKPVLAGMYFGFLYIFLGSIIPIIVLHILQDLVVVNLLDEQNSLES